MYKGLWNLVNRVTDKESVLGVYLAANIIFWAVGTIGLGVGAGLFLHWNIVSVLGNIVCTGAYVGIIFGLIGGIMFYYKCNKGEGL